MPVVRYVALAALVVWMGGAAQSMAGEWFRSVDRVGLACGVVMLTCLFVMKFVGPPPHDFTMRAVLVALIVAINAAALVWGRSSAATAVSLALGFVLLSWYARE